MAERRYWANEEGRKSKGVSEYSYIVEVIRSYASVGANEDSINAIASFKVMH